MQKIQTFSSICAKIRLPRSSCRRCLSVCPVGAIEFGQDVVKVGSVCLGCELCVAVCPNGVFSVSDAKGKDNPIADRLYCSKLIADQFDPTSSLPPEIIPCISSLSPTFLLQLALRIKRPVEVSTGQCERCVMERVLSHFEKVTEEVRSLFELFRIPHQPLIVRRGTERDKAAARKHYHAFETTFDRRPHLERRNFLLKLSGPVLYAGRPRHEEDGEKKDVMALEKRIPERLTTLIALFRDHQDVFSPGDRIPFYAEIVIDSSCSGCGVCAVLCPTGALAIKRTERWAYMGWTPSHCSQCHLCEEACPERSLHLFPGLDVEKVIDESTHAIQSFNRNICPDCQYEFLSRKEGDPCPYCQKQEEVMQDYLRTIYGQSWNSIVKDESTIK